MKTSRAIQQFINAKTDLSLSYRTQCQNALSALLPVVPKLPGTPDQLRQAINQANTPWMKLYLWNVYQAFYRWCHREYDLANPMEKVDRPKVPEVEIRALEPAQLAGVLASTLDNFDKSIVSLALDAGIRASEFGQLRVRDISPETILVHGKGNRILRVPISPETYYLLQEVIDSIPECGPDSLLFTNRKGEPVSRFIIYRTVRGCMERAGLDGPKMGPHCLRHSLGTNYINDGGDPFSLKRIMRHKNISTTQKYVNLSLKQVIESHNRHSPLKEALRGAQGVLFDMECPGSSRRKRC